MRSYPNKSYPWQYCVIFARPACHFLCASSPGRFFVGNGVPSIQLERMFLPKLKIQLQTEVMTSWVQFSGGFCSFPWFPTNRCLFRCSIYKGNMKENQGNEQNPPNNCTQEVIASVRSWIIVNFGKKSFRIGCAMHHFRRKNDRGMKRVKSGTRDDVQKLVKMTHK